MHALSKWSCEHSVDIRVMCPVPTVVAAGGYVRYFVNPARVGDKKTVYFVYESKVSAHELDKSTG